MSRTVLALMVDALRHDFVTPERMPWLHGLTGQGAQLAAVEETFGFIGVRSSVFFGLYPESSGYVFLYNVAERGDFWFLRWLPDRFLDGSRRRKKKLIRRYSRLRKWFDREYVKPWDLSRVPARVLKHVQVAETRPPWSRRYLPGRSGVFQEVDSYLYFGYPAGGGGTDELRGEFRRRFDGQQLVWMHFSEVDLTEHRHGASSREVVDKLREIDGALREVYEQACKRGPVELLVFGDHGCMDVTASHDVLGWIPPALRERTLYFLDSTMARFWCQDAATEQEIRTILSGRPEVGALVERDVLEQKYRCRYERRVFGDLLFVVHAGVMICPNFFQSDASEALGMHGYLPEVDDNCGAVLLHTERAIELPRRIEMPYLNGVLEQLLRK